MSILIQGAEMPLDCWRCPCSHPEYGYCRVDKDARSITGDIPKWCPIIPVPTPHGPLVDVRVVYDAIVKVATEHYGLNLHNIERALEITPTIVEAEEKG